MSIESLYLLWAVSLGAISALSLPLGSLWGLLAAPKPVVSAMLAAFGAGALLAALTLELLAPMIAGLDHKSPAATYSFAVLLVSMVTGGLLFTAVDYLLDQRGGFLRKMSTSITWFNANRQRETEDLVMELCAVPLVRALPEEHIQQLIEVSKLREFHEGDVVQRENAEADALYIIRSGSLALSRRGAFIRTVGAGECSGRTRLAG